MSVRGLALAFLLCVPSAMHAAWTPIIQPSYVHLRPGETVTVQVSAAWTSGISVHPFTPWTFRSEDPAIATIDGYVPSASVPYELKITAHAPGVTHARVIDPPAPVDRPWMVVVVAERELPLRIGVNGVIAKGHPVTLTAVSDEPDATFTWYPGKLGEILWVAGRGRELTFVPQFTAHLEYWVLMTTPRGAGAASIVVKVREAPGRRRSIRHE